MAKLISATLSVGYDKPMAEGAGQQNKFRRLKQFENLYKFILQSNRNVNKNISLYMHLKKNFKEIG